MGKQKLNIGHNLDFSISQFVNRSSYWGHENGEINLPSVTNCPIKFSGKNIKDQAAHFLPSNAWQHTLYTYLEITAKNQLLEILEVIQKININSKNNLVLIQNQPVFLKQRKVGFVLPKERMVGDR